MPGADPVARPATAAGTGKAVGALLALAVGAFCYVAMETLPVGLLPLVSEEFGVSLADTGLLVSSYGLTVAIVSLPLTYATRRVPRHVLLPVLLAIFVVATVASATATGYAMLLGARVLAALSQSVFWAVAGPAAASLFPVRLRGRASATVFGGSALAPMLGVPAGTWIGQQAGWRWSFAGLALAGLLAMILLALLMPRMPAGATHAATGTAPSVRGYAFLTVITVLAVAAMFAAFTYTAPFLTDVSGFPAVAISPLLLLRGVVNFTGIVTAGAVLHRGVRGTMLVSLTVMAVSFFGMYAFARVPVVLVIMLALSGFALGALAPTLQNRVLEVAPGNTDLASAGNGVAFNVGIAGGAFLGGIILQGSGAAETVLAGGLIALLALALVLAEPWLAPHHDAVRERD
jgi:MFS transporter, DHA1 family, inner membrane transport protein